MNASFLTYRPRRAPLQSASVSAAAVFLVAPCFAAFVYDNPLVLAGSLAAVVVAGLMAGAGWALAGSLRWTLWLVALIVLVNPLVTSRGLTVLARGPELPIFGPLDVTLEALTAGGILGLRVLVVALAFAVYSSCVDPDRVLRALRPLARRSALTATMIVRMVPVAAADSRRLRDAAALRGPLAAPVGRGALVRRLVAGSLDRSVDLAATLELRGYGLDSPSPGRDRHRSRHDRAFLAAGGAMVVLAATALLASQGTFHAYPSLSMESGPLVLALAAALPLLALTPFIFAGGRHA